MNDNVVPFPSRVHECGHGDDRAYVLIMGAVAVRYCRERGCARWRITLFDAERSCEGAGLENYQAAIDSVAKDHPAAMASADVDGAEFLRAVGGHAQEIAWQEDSDGRYSGRGES